MSMNEKSSKIDVSQCSGEYWMSNLPEEVTRKPLVCLAIPGFYLLFEKIFMSYIFGDPAVVIYSLVIYIIIDCYY